MLLWSQWLCCTQIAQWIVFPPSLYRWTCVMFTNSRVVYHWSDSVHHPGWSCTEVKKPDLDSLLWIHTHTFWQPHGASCFIKHFSLLRHCEIQMAHTSLKCRSTSADVQLASTHMDMSGIGAIWLCPEASAVQDMPTAVCHVWRR